MVMVMALGTVCTVFAGTYEQCRESIDSAGQFFSSYDLSGYILGNDVFAVLGRIPDIMEITLISHSPLRLDISSFTTLGSESVCDIQIRPIALSAIVFIRDMSLTPSLRSIIEEKYFPGQLLPTIYCSEILTSPAFGACCVYEVLQSRRSLSADRDEPEIKRANTESSTFKPPLSINIATEFSFGSIDTGK